MKKLLALAVLAANAACHEPYSNEDLLFLYEGVPPDVQIVVPTPDGPTDTDVPPKPPPTGAARFYVDARRSADSVNRDLLSILGWVEAIIVSPPSRREEDRRVWGPLPGDRGVLYTLVAERVRTSTVIRATSTSTPAEVDSVFGYVMFASSPRAPTGRAVFAGQQAAGARGGVQGGLILDLDASRAVDPASMGTGQMAVTYDTRFDQATVELVSGALEMGADPSAAWRNTWESDGSGTFQFFVSDDVDPATAQPEVLFVGARWLADGRGRADVSSFAGDLRLPLVASECWDTGFRRTFLQSNIPTPEFAPEGRLTDCAPELRMPQFPQ